MSASSVGHRARFVPALILGAASWYVLDASGPVLRGPHINPFSAIAAFLLLLCAVTVLAETLGAVVRLVNWIRARRPTGLKGTAGFVKSLREIRHDLVANEWGPYWGTFKGKEIISGYASNALSLGPSGTGKGIGVVQPTILSIRDSKTVICFKGENTAVLARPLRERGERVRIVNIGDMWPDILGPSDAYNPMTILAQNYLRPGGLLDVSEDCFEVALQLYPDPPNGPGENKYFYDGSRAKINFALQTAILINGTQAGMSDVMLLLGRAELLRHAQWAAGRLKYEDGSTAEMPLHDQPWAELHDPEDVENYIVYYKAMAVEVADILEAEDSKSAEAFLKGAQEALRPFNPTTRAHKKINRSTFSFSDQKEGDAPTTVFLVVDASKINAQMPVLSLLLWCMCQEIKRHPNKTRPVYLIADEATNYKIDDLGSLVTWGRGYGLHIHLIFQSFSAFTRQYGKDVLSTVLSECEILQFLAGQREPDTLEMIEKLLAEQSIIASSHKGSLGRGAAFGVDGFDYREEGRALMTRDEIRRTDKTILVIRKNKPVLTDLPPIAAIEPFRSQIDINPFHGKPFLRPVKLRLKRQVKKGAK